MSEYNETYPWYSTELFPNLSNPVKSLVQSYPVPQQVSQPSCQQEQLQMCPLPPQRSRHQHCPQQFPQLRLQPLNSNSSIFKESKEQNKSVSLFDSSIISLVIFGTKLNDSANKIKNLFYYFIFKKHLKRIHKEGTAARKITRVILCYSIKKRRLRLSKTFVKEYSRKKENEYTPCTVKNKLRKIETKYLVYTLNYNIEFLQTISTYRIRHMYNSMNILIHESEKTVCNIPGCKALVHPTKKQEHLHRSHYGIVSNKQIQEFLKEHDYEEDACGICCEKLNNGNCIAHLPYCSHAFHKHCIDGWFKIKKSCPTCRKEIFDEPEEQHLYTGMADSCVIQYCVGYDYCQAITKAGYYCTKSAQQGSRYCGTHRHWYR